MTKNESILVNELEKNMDTLLARNRELEAQSERRRWLLEKSDERVNRLSDEIKELEAQLAAAHDGKRITEELQLVTAAELDEANAQLTSAREDTAIVRAVAMELRKDTEARLASARDAENARLTRALEKVEAYMASEEGPICRLWENCDIGDYDDYQTDWEQTLFDVRDWKNGCVPVASLGGGAEWPVIVLYREILQVLAPEPPAEKVKE